MLEFGAGAPRPSGPLGEGLEVVEWVRWQGSRRPLPLGPLSPGQLKTRNVAWELQISAQFTPGLVNIGFSNKVPVRVKEKKVLSFR